LPDGNTPLLVLRTTSSKGKHVTGGGNLLSAYLPAPTVILSEAVVPTGTKGGISSMLLLLDWPPTVATPYPAAPDLSTGKRLT